MTTNVPLIQFTDNGPVVPTTAEILAGVQQDMNAAFGGDLNPSLTTPQGQLATCEAELLAQVNAAWVNLINMIDPAYSSGRWQDAIGRLYELSRNAAQATVLQISCAGADGLTIPVGALVQDVLGNQYACTSGGVIISGSITLSFENTIVGAIAVPASVTIYQTISGWDSATLISGVLGTDLESSVAFEIRRQSTVAANSNNQNEAILGTLLQVAGVTSAYVQDNFESDPIAVNPETTVTGSISGAVLTVTAGTGILVNQAVSGLGVTNGTYISSFAGGSGGTGTYNLNKSMTVPSSTLYLGGASIDSKSLYCCVAGGAAADIAYAIWSKKNPGCGLTGSTSQTVYDTSTIYGSPGIAYTIKYQVAVDTPIYFEVNIKNSSLVPSDATVLIQQAIVDAFSGADGGIPAQINGLVISSRFTAGILSLGNWAQLLSVQLGLTVSPTGFQLQVGIKQIPVTDAAHIVVNLI